MNYLKIILLLVLVFNLNFLYSQRPGGGAGQGQVANQMPSKPGVGGKLIDAQTNKPIPYASVALYNLSDSKLVGGSISSEDGRFFIETPNGNYSIEISFMGYDRFKKSEIQITDKMPMARLGIIKLNQAVVKLEGVEVIGNQSYVEYKIDRKVVNVERDLGASGGSAVDALENVPSVSVDIEGNVALRGSSNFVVMINGKPSPLSGGDALQQIPTAMIKNIEIITNPSAKYDPDGMSGIINVILKDNVSNGFNGFVEASYGSFGTYGVNSVLNYRKDKINYFVGLDAQKGRMPGTSGSDLINFASDTNMLRTSEISRMRGRSNYTAKAGIDYYLNAKNTISLEGAYGLKTGLKNFTGNIYERTNPTTYQLFTISQSVSSNEGEFYSGNLTWQHLFKREGEKLEATAFYSKDTDNDVEDQKENLSDASFTNYGPIDDWYHTTEEEVNSDLRLKADYTRTLSRERKLEAGLQSRIYREENNFVFTSFDTLSDTWLTNANQGNRIAFDRDIHAGYLTYSGVFRKTGYQLGMRGEYTYRSIEELDGGENYVINRFDFFPTIHLSQKIGESNSILASYSRRVDRPDGGELNPNPMFISSNFIRVGNPALEDEYTDNIELSYQKTLKNSFVSLEAYYRSTKNKISRLQQMDENNITYMSFANMDRDYSLGLELMANLQFTKWFRMNLSGNYYYYHLLGNLYSGAVDQSNYNYDFRADLNFMITSLMRFQLNGMYRAPSVTAQGEMAEFYMLNTALRYDFFDRKLTATLNVKDIFNTSRHEFYTYSSSFNNHNQFNRQGPQINLTLSYKINNYTKEKRNGMEEKREEGGGEM